MEGGLLQDEHMLACGGDSLCDGKKMIRGQWFDEVCGRPQGHTVCDLT